MKVTLDIFSGRENPTWDLSKKDTKKLVDIVAQKALPSVDAVESILGFRGYVISVVSHDTQRVRSGSALAIVYCRESRRRRGSGLRREDD